MHMPADLIFPIDDIVLSDVVGSYEHVGQINPQQGDMRQLDHIIWTNDQKTQILGVKQVTDSEFWIEGHIPGRPLMPGVLMIEAGAQLSSYLYHIKTPDAPFVGFTRCNDVIFRGQVVPGNTLYLLADELEFRPRRFICKTQGIVDGAVVFEAQITGMVI